MGLFDAILGQAPALLKMAAGNPRVLQAALALLSSRDASVGGTGGLPGILAAFEQKGLGEKAASWVSTGPNPPVTGAELESVLGGDVLGQFASAAGLPQAQAGGALASVLPMLVDKLTPGGEVPGGGALETAIGSLLRGLGRSTS